MTLRKLSLAALISGFCFASCTKAGSTNPVASSKDTLTLTHSDKMHSYVSTFEIPANDLSRAVNFYQAILDLPIEKMELPGMQMGILPYEGQAVTGIIIQAEGYTPSANGITLYLNGGDDLQIILDKVEKNGGTIQLPKTPHADGDGFFALFLDSEGNKIGLHSPN